MPITPDARHIPHCTLAIKQNHDPIPPSVYDFLHSLRNTEPQQTTQPRQSTADTNTPHHQPTNLRGGVRVKGCDLGYKIAQPTATEYDGGRALYEDEGPADAVPPVEPGGQDPQPLPIDPAGPTWSSQD